MRPDRGLPLLIQFAKSPVPGEVKSRMIPHLSPEEAMALHCELVCRTARTLVNARLGDVQIAVAGDASHALFETCRSLGVSDITRQSGEGLGERMYRALQAGLEHHDAVVLVGSDCPGLDRAYLAGAINSLTRAEIVLGPAEDGGYVLIGARNITPEVFRDIEWGTSSVYRQTVSRLIGAGFDWQALPIIRDIDRPGDLAYWEAIKDPGSPQVP